MIRMRLLVFISFLLSVFINHYEAIGQSAILVASDGKFYDFDIVNGVSTTKEKTNFCNLNRGGFSVAQYKNKVFYNTGAGELYETDLQNPALCRSMGIRASGNAMTADRNGTIYWVSGNELYRLPNGATKEEKLGRIPFSASGDLIFYGDKLLMAASNDGPNRNFCLVEINIASPENSKVYMETTGYVFYGIMNISNGCNENKVYAISSSLLGTGSDIVELDMVNRRVLGVIGSVNFIVFDAASITESGELSGINVNSITVKPECLNNGLGEINIAATSANVAAKLFFSFNNNPATETALFSNLSSGNYPIRITSSNGCSKDTFAVVPYVERLKVSMAIIPDTCNSLKGAVTVNNISNHIGIRFSLDNAAYVTGNVFNNISEGIKSLKVIEPNGCILDTSFVVGTFQPLIPVSSINVTSARCSNSNGAITLNYKKGSVITGVRLNGGPLQKTNQLVNLTAGTHYVQIVMASCIYDTTVIVPLQVTKEIDISRITVKPECANSGFGEVTVVATSTTNTAKLFFSYNNNPATESGVLSNLAAGNYSIKVSSSDGCSKDTFAVVPYVDRLKVSMVIIPDTCGAVKGAVTINTISNDAGMRFSLENAAFVTGNKFSNLSAGIKSLKVIETNGCVLDTSFSVISYRPPIPVAALNITSANCSNADGAIAITYVAGANIQGVRINGGAVQSSNQFTNLLAGTYQLQIITASCIYDTTVSVPLQNTVPPVVSYLSNSPDCGSKSNGSLQINLTGTVAPYTYSFNNSPYTSATSYQNLVHGSYPVAIKDAQGCIFTDTATIAPYIAKPVTVQSGIMPADCWQAGGKVTIMVKGTEAPYFYRINQQAYQAGQQASGLAPGTYMALISNGNNCLVDSTPVTITAQQIPGVVCDTVYVPTGFTPNGDGKNDVLKPTTSTTVNNFIFRVYNRVGQVIFETSQPQAGWNGRYKAIDQPQGTYVWTFAYTRQDGYTKVFRGTVVLIR